MSEHDEQKKVFDVLRLNESQHPQLAGIFAVPNGGHRHKAVAGKLRAEGVKSGVPDICIPIPSKIDNEVFHGAYIEMKFGKNKPTDSQKAFAEFLTANGYAVYLCYDADQALNFIENYCGIKLRGRAVRVCGSPRIDLKGF